MRDIFPRSQSAFRTNPTNRAYTRIRLGGARSWKPGGEKTRAQLAFGMIINRFPPDLARVQGKPFFCASYLSLSLVGVQRLRSCSPLKCGGCAST